MALHILRNSARYLSRIQVDKQCYSIALANGIRPPLRGIKIVDLTRVLAGPTATMLLADLGADVVKVEEVTRGTTSHSPLRELSKKRSPKGMILVRVLIFPRLAYHPITKHTGSWTPPSAPIIDNAPKQAAHLPAESAYFLAVNRNKRSITVNLKKPEGLKIMHKLIAQADVLVENFVSDKLAEIGLGWEDCNTINPRLIYASITGMWPNLHTSHILHLI
jgi:succinate---hydroxymethylglutarate CoA-transferase